MAWLWQPVPAAAVDEGVSGTAAESQAQSTSASGTVAPPVAGTATTSQNQTIAGSGAFVPLAITGSSSTGQAQTANGVGTFTTGVVTGDCATSQAQAASADGVSIPLVTGAAAVSQAQTSSGAGTFTPQTVSGGASSSQAQSIDGIGAFSPQEIYGTGASYQSQSASGVGTFASHVFGVASTSHVQSASAIGSISFVEASAGHSQEYSVRKWYIRRGKKIHVFETAQDADEWLDAESKANQAIEKAREASKLDRKKKQRVYKALDTATDHEVIRLDVLAEKAKEYQIPAQVDDLARLEDWSEVARIALLVQRAEQGRQYIQYLAQDDEEIEMLLLSM